MDKYEYSLKLDQIKSLSVEGKHAEAAEIADTINWNKIKNVNALVKAGEVYENVGRYEDSRDILLNAYDHSPIGRTIIYRLAEVAIKMQDYTAAQEYYDEFVDIAPHDNQRYVLKYNIMKAKGASHKELVPVLEEFKDQEYTEEWAYELAHLYHKTGAVDKCIEACDELILWFGDGPYVERALELKMLYQPLTKSQEEKYRKFRHTKEGKTLIEAEEMIKAGEYGHDPVVIPQVTLNQSKFNTINLQEEIAKGMQQIMDATEKETVVGTMDTIKKIVEEIPYLQLPREEDRSVNHEQHHIETDEEIDGSLKINFQELLGEESDGQMSMVVDEKAALEKQITGQMTIAEVLEEWEKTKRAAETALHVAEQKKLESAKARALQEAENIMDRLNDVLPKIEAGITPRELLEEEYLHKESLEEAIQRVDDAHTSLDMTMRLPQLDKPIYVPKTDVFVRNERMEGEIEHPKVHREDLKIEELEIPKIDEVENTEAIEEVEELKIPEMVAEVEDAEVIEEVEELKIPEMVDEVEDAEVIEEVEELKIPEMVDEVEDTEVIEEVEELKIPEVVAEVEDTEVIEEVEELQIPEVVVEAEDIEEPKVSKKDIIKAKTSKIPDISMPEDLDKEEAPSIKPIKELTDEQKAIFSYFVPVKGMELQLCDALTGGVRHLKQDKTASTGNIIIQGGQGCGKTMLATSLVKVLQKECGKPNGRVGKIDAEALNKKDVQQLLRKVAGGCLIIENAGELERTTAVTLSLLLEQDSSGILVILEASAGGVKKAMALDDGFAKKFTESISVPMFSNDELVTFAKAYANELGYEIEEMAVLALYNRISNIQRLDQATRLEEIKDIVDGAIEKEAKSGLRKFVGILTAKRYTDEEQILLTEKDFV